MNISELFAVLYHPDMSGLTGDEGSWPEWIGLVGSVEEGIVLCEAHAARVADEWDDEDDDDGDGDDEEGGGPMDVCRYGDGSVILCDADGQMHYKIAVLTGAARG